jgi:hypothetical protein
MKGENNRATLSGRKEFAYVNCYGSRLMRVEDNIGPGFTRCGAAKGKESIKKLTHGTIFHQSDLSLCF